MTITGSLLASFSPGRLELSWLVIACLGDYARPTSDYSIIRIYHIPPAFQKRYVKRYDWTKKDDEANVDYFARIYAQYGRQLHERPSQIDRWYRQAGKS